MNTCTGQKRHVRIVAAILLISMLLDNYLISPLASVPSLSPWLSRLPAINPLVVFLDIPADLPITFGIVQVLLFFWLGYALCCYPYHAKYKVMARQWFRQRLWRVITAISIIPLLVLSGGVAYALAHDHLPRYARNAIESFGINLDLRSSYPGHEIIHLRGSMVMLCCFFFGVRWCALRIGRSAPYAELPQTEPALQRASENPNARPGGHHRRTVREEATIDAA